MPEVVDGEETERAIKSVVLGWIDRSAVDRISITPGEDNAGESSLYVNVYLRDDRSWPTAAKSIDLIIAMRDALRDLGDDRFPHLSFSAPGDEPSEDTRPTE